MFLAVGLIVFALLATGIVWWMTPRPVPLARPSTPPAVPSKQVAAPTAALPVAPTQTATPTLPTPPVLPASNAFTTLEDYRQRRRAEPRPVEPEIPAPAGRSPATELARIVRTVRDYRAVFGSNPVGLNKEIVRTLLGDNPRGAKFLDPATAHLNAQGELLDDWGHPFFFHALSGTVMEIRSAGPDGRVFTPDDLVQ